MEDRAKTGIKGFDELVEGGFPRGSTILLCGTPGTGKSIFGLEFLYNGAAKFKERGLYVTFEQSPDALKMQAKRMGWDFDKLEKNGSVKIMHVLVKDIDQYTIENIKKEIQKNKISRLVIDSLSTLSINAPIYAPTKDIALVDIMKHKSFFSPPIMGDFVVKRFIYTFIDDLAGIDSVTSLLVSEASEKGEYLSRDTISEFVCDGVVVINFEAMGGEFSRSLLVRKMRNTKNDEDIHPLEISEKGLIVHTIK